VAEADVKNDQPINHAASEPDLSWEVDENLRVRVVVFFKRKEAVLSEACLKTRKAIKLMSEGLK
jgi:hypothetical protein